MSVDRRGYFQAMRFGLVSKSNSCDVFRAVGPGLDGIVAQKQLHTPRFGPAALSSVEVSGNRGNDKTP